MWLGSPHLVATCWVRCRYFAQLFTAVVEEAWYLAESVPPEPSAIAPQTAASAPPTVATGTTGFTKDECAAALDVIAARANLSPSQASAAIDMIAKHASYLADAHAKGAATPTKRKRRSDSSDADSTGSGSVGPGPQPKQVRTGDADSTGSAGDDDGSSTDSDGGSDKLDGIALLAERIARRHSSGSGSEGSKGGGAARLVEALMGAPPSLRELGATAAIALVKLIPLARTSFAYQWEELMDTLRTLVCSSATLAAEMMSHNAVALLCHAFQPRPQDEAQFGRLPRDTPHSAAFAWLPLLSTLLECLRCSDLSQVQTHHTGATNPMCYQDRVLVSMGDTAPAMLTDQAFLRDLFLRPALRTSDVADVRQHLALLLCWNNATVTAQLAVVLRRFLTSAHPPFGEAGDFIALARHFMCLEDAGELRWTRVETITAGAVEALRNAATEHHTHPHSGAMRRAHHMLQLLEAVASVLCAPDFPQVGPEHAQTVASDLLAADELASQVAPGRHSALGVAAQRLVGLQGGEAAADVATSDALGAANVDTDMVDEEAGGVMPIGQANLIQPLVTHGSDSEDDAAA